jgi:hypothetical protein
MIALVRAMGASGEGTVEVDQVPASGWLAVSLLRPDVAPPRHLGQGLGPGRSQSFCSFYFPFQNPFAHIWEQIKDVANINSLDAFSSSITNMAIAIVNQTPPTIIPNQFFIPILPSAS